jgi:hypothetical protein
LVRVRVGRGEELPADGGFYDGGDVLEDVAFCEDVAAGVDLECVPGGVIPVVVYLGGFTC